MLDVVIDTDVAVITLDDGKANAVGHAFIDAVTAGLDQAQAEAKCALLVGREGIFSAGFDLKELGKGPSAAAALVNKGAEMLLRLFTHPQPVVAACTGHAIAAGALVMLAADTRLCADGDYKLGLNETAIDMTLPVFAIQLARARLSKRHQTQAVVQGTLFDPAQACDVGFSDRVVPETQLLDQAIECARSLAELPQGAHAANKLAMRQPYIDAISASLSA